MDKNIIVGIITERDIIEKVILQNKAAKIMKDNNIKKLPVILNNEIVGIITETDLTRTIYTFSEAVDELARFYNDRRENLEKMMDGETY